jgi:hypothetical protein
MERNDREHERWMQKITDALRSFRLDARFGVVVAGTAAVAACAGRDARPPVNPETSIHSTSPDEMPATQPSGLGDTGGHEDAGLPHVAPDGGLQRSP